MAQLNDMDIPSLVPSQAVEQVKWGKIKEKDVWLFCLKNKKGTKLYVSNFGATAQSLLFRDKNKNMADIVLGYDTLEQYKNDEYYMGAVIGRCANRIASSDVWIEGEKYSLSVRSGGFHLHGGEQGFNKKVFDYTLPEDSQSSVITFSYTSDDMEEGFPGTLHLDVTYTLDDADQWVVEYRAFTNKTTIINLTQHSYFNLSGNLSTSIIDHDMCILAQYFLPVNKIQVPTGSITKVVNTPFDFRIPKAIAKDLTLHNEQLLLSHGYDHSFVLEKEHSPDLKHAAFVRDPLSGRQMDVYTTEPAIHFYSGNFLQGIIGKGGLVYNKHFGFCLETQHFPDAPNHAHFPSIVLKAGVEYYSKTVFALSIQ